MAPAEGYTACCHARPSERLPDSPQLRENELLAFYRSFAFLLDALKSEPDFYGLDEVLKLELRVSGLADECDRLDREIKLAAGNKGRLVELRNARVKARRALLRLEKSYNERIPLRLGQIRLLAALAASHNDFEGMITRLYPKSPHLGEDPAVPERLAQKEMDKLLASHKKLNAMHASIGLAPLSEIRAKMGQRRADGELTAGN